MKILSKDGLAKVSNLKKELEKIAPNSHKADSGTEESKESPRGKRPPSHAVTTILMIVEHLSVVIEDNTDACQSNWLLLLELIDMKPQAYRPEHFDDHHQALVKTTARFLDSFKLQSDLVSYSSFRAPINAAIMALVRRGISNEKQRIIKNLTAILRLHAASRSPRLSAAPAPVITEEKQNKPSAYQPPGGR
jgi:DNA primase